MTKHSPYWQGDIPRLLRKANFQPFKICGHTYALLSLQKLIGFKMETITWSILVADRYKLKQAYKNWAISWTYLLTFINYSLKTKYSI